MKKIFTFVLLTFLTLSVQAQDKKSWDLKGGGLSAVTIANLDADTDNWTKEGTNEDGSTKGWKEATKHTGAFKANNEVIEELAGIELVNSGLSKNNNVIIRKDRIRFNRDKMKFTLPQLKNGQTITMVCQSANSTATDRGVKASYDYMKRIEGPEDNLIPGPDGIITNKWQIETDATEPVDVEFTMIKGGIDFYLIQIDNGDEPQVFKLAYLYNGEDDHVLTYLKANELNEITPINVTTTIPSVEELQAYDVTIIGGTVPANGDAVNTLKDALPWLPVLNMNGALYSAWGYGEAVETSSVLVAVNTKNKIFTDITFNETEGFPAVLLNGEMASMYGLTLGEYFEGDEVLANPINETGDGGDKNITAIHTHNLTHNGYIYLPYVAAGYTDDGYKLLSNALNMLKKSKMEISAATAPTISRVYKNLLTQVTIKAPNLPKAKVYYTTDGTDPTIESTLYTEPFELTKACTVKAVAIAEGYTLSAVTSLDILIKEQPAVPVIAYEMNDGNTKLTFTCTTPETTIWYNFVGAVDTLKSTKYADSIDVVITMPQNVTTFATVGEAGEEVFSESDTQRVLVKNPRVVIDVAAHFSAQQWTADNNPAGLSVANGKGMFSWGASAVSMYTGAGTPGVDPETGDSIIIYTDKDLRDYEIVNEPGENPEWKLKSRGTCLIWQNLGAQTTNFGDNSNYNPTASTDVDSLFPVTKNDIQFYKFYANEPGNGSIETINKYQAPLDVVVLANMQGGPLQVQVSTDSIAWQSIGEIAKTGHSRMWGKSTLSYNGTDEVYVRVTEEVTSGGPKVFDIYIANQGEKSKALLEELNQELTGIQEIHPATTTLPSGIYGLNGLRKSRLQRGLNIVVGNDGQVRKMIVK